jgi:predicted Zn finger-like uncharacterized protein
MLLKCPACSAKYKIANTAIPASGRNVRCVACGHFWFQRPIDELNELELDNNSAVQEESLQRNDSGRGFSSQKQKQSAPHQKIRKAAVEKKIFAQISAIAIGWSLAIAVVGIGLYAAINNRNAIATKWPRSATAFAFLGMPANTFGVEISNVKVKSGIDNQGPRLVISGTIRSISNVDKIVPYLRVSLVDDTGTQKAKWLADPGVTVLNAHGTKNFETVWRNPPTGSLTAIVTFSQAPSDVARPNAAKIARKALDDNSVDKLAGGNEDNHQPAPTASR